MTQEELDKKAGELFSLLDKGIEENLGSASSIEGQIIKAILMMAIELVADVKRMTASFELLNKGLCSIIDLQAASYQNGIIVQVKNPIEFGIEEETIEGSEEISSKGLEEDKADDSTRHGNNRAD